MTETPLSKPSRRIRAGLEADETKALRDQFRVTLQAAVRKIEDSGKSPKAVARIKRLLIDKDDWLWKDAYEVEQQLVLLYDQMTLRTELARRTLESRHVLYPNVSAWYEEQVKKAKTVDEQRALLLRLVNDLQWRYTVGEAKLGYIKQITGRTGLIFIWAVAIFVAFMFVRLVGDGWSWEDSELFKRWWYSSERFRTLLLAAVSGYLGASFSMLSGLKARLESSGINGLKSANTRAVLLSRVLIGTGAAMILYFFFESELLAGEAFPNIPALEGETTEGLKHLALLVVWCFVAGFSEKLVPGLLAKTEAQIADQAQTSPHGSVAPEVEDAQVDAPRLQPEEEAEASGSEDELEEEADEGADEEEPEEEAEKGAGEEAADGAAEESAEAKVEGEGRKQPEE